MGATPSISARALSVLLLWVLTSGQRLAAGVEWVVFEDPLEHAFRAEVPRDWTARGGLVRMGDADFRPMLDLVSPDGRTHVRIGDAWISASAHPSPYRSGPEYAVLYARVRLLTPCPRAAADLAAMDFILPDPAASAAAQTPTSTGQIAYRCDSAQGPWVMFAFARTSAAHGSWQVETLASFSSPPEQVPQAQGVLLHTLRSFRVLAQNAPAAPPLRIAQALRGVEPTGDPLARPLTSRPELPLQFWTNGLGQVVNTVFPPSSAWRALRLQAFE
jgi:hypothetical protein